MLVDALFSIIFHVAHFTVHPLLQPSFQIPFASLSSWRALANLLQKSQLPSFDLIFSEE